MIYKNSYMGGKYNLPLENLLIQFTVLIIKGEET